MADEQPTPEVSESEVPATEPTVEAESSTPEPAEETATESPGSSTSDPATPTPEGDDAGVVGHFVQIVAGPHAGCVGTLMGVDRGVAVVKARDPRGSVDLVGVDYADVRPWSR